MAIERIVKVDFFYKAVRSFDCFGKSFGNCGNAKNAAAGSYEFAFLNCCACNVNVGSNFFGNGDFKALS